MNDGKVFEQSWKNSIPPDVYYLRIIDPAIGWGNDKENTGVRFAPKNPFDALMYSYPNLFLMELKSTKGTSYSFTGKTPMIKKHQIEELTKAINYKGIVAGFVFNMRSVAKTYFLHIEDFNRFMVETEKKSINEKDIKNYGAIEVIGKLKKVKYGYYIGEFIEKCKNDEVING